MWISVTITKVLMAFTDGTTVAYQQACKHVEIVGFIILK